MRITRAEKSVLSDWWFTVDRLMFFGLLLLMGAGLVLSLAASPPIAAKYNLEPFYFVRRQAALLLPARRRPRGPVRAAHHRAVCHRAACLRAEDVAGCRVRAAPSGVEQG